MTVQEVANPAGVEISALPGGGITPAIVRACFINGALGSLELKAGDTVVVTCSSITVEVRKIGESNPPIAITFTAEDGTESTVAVDEGNSITFDPTDQTFSTPETNRDTLVIVSTPTACVCWTGAGPRSCRPSGGATCWSRS